MQPVYLALGDSVAAGIGATSRASGYVGQLTGILRLETACAPGLQRGSGADVPLAAARSCSWSTSPKAAPRPAA